MAILRIGKCRIKNNVLKKAMISFRAQIGFAAYDVAEKLVRESLPKGGYRIDNIDNEIRNVMYYIIDTFVDENERA